MLLRQISHYLVSTLRFALCLLCAGTCVLFAAMWFDLVPDPARCQAESRAQFADSIAAQTTDIVRGHRWRKLETALEAITLASPEIESTGFRTPDEMLRISTGRHETVWDRNSRSTNQTSRSLTVGDTPLGTLEITFGPQSAGFPIDPQLQLMLAVIAAIYLTHLFFWWWIPRSREARQIVSPRVHEALDSIAEGVVLLDANEQILLANKAFADMCNSTQQGLVGTKASSLPWVLAEGAVPEEFPWIDAVEQQQPQVDRRLNLELPGGHQRSFSVISKPTGSGRKKWRGALVTFRDVTEVEEHRAQLESMLVMLNSNRDEISRKNRELQILATKDSLTGCLNRRAFFERFDSHMKSHLDAGRPLSCIMVDNDHFKNINDTYGHHTGDRVLIRVAETLRELNQGDQLVCRYGGEEFCIALPDTPLEQAAVAAEKIRQAIAEIQIEEHQDLKLSVSVGASDLRFGATTPQDVINEADQALYHAKDNGRNRVVCYDPSLAAENGDDQPANTTELSSSCKIPYQAVSALLSGLSYRDSDTANHCRRVADLCVAAGENLLSSHELYLLEIAAQLHDIGKLGVPDELLLSQQPLTEEQWEKIVQHERLGIELIHETFNSGELTKIVNSARAHFDGSGRKLEQPMGESIPKAARLLAIADSFDSMVADRPYRPGRSFEEAFVELRRCGGTQFDPDLVEHFIASVQARTATQAHGGFDASHDGFGTQIQRLAEALDARDVEGIVALASRLKEAAAQQRATQIAEVAEALERCAQQEEPQLLPLVKLTSQLLSIVHAVKAPAAGSSTTVKS